jgi:hypothetical protein
MLRYQTVRGLLVATLVLESEAQDAVDADHAATLGTVASPTAVLVHVIDLGDLVVGGTAVKPLDIKTVLSLAPFGIARRGVYLVVIPPSHREGVARDAGIGVGNPISHPFPALNHMAFRNNREALCF